MDRVRIPAGLNDEDIFLSWGFVKMSIRQMCTVFGALFLWWGIASYIVGPTFHIRGLFAMLGTIWLPAAGFALAYLPIRGRPLDVWLGQWFSFRFGVRTYLLREQKQGWQSSTETDLYSDEDVDTMLEHLERPRVVE